MVGTMSGRAASTLGKGRANEVFWIQRAEPDFKFYFEK
jgi:hypothetical protein